MLLIHIWKIAIVLISSIPAFVSVRFWERKLARGCPNGWQMVGQTMLWFSQLLAHYRARWTANAPYSNISLFSVGVNIGSLLERQANVVLRNGRQLVMNNVIVDVTVAILFGNNVVPTHI